VLSLLLGSDIGGRLARHIQPLLFPRASALRPDRLADADQAGLDAILVSSPELPAITAAVRSFAVIMNERRGRKLLEPWMTAALATAEPALRSFVTGQTADVRTCRPRPAAASSSPTNPPPGKTTETAPEPVFRCR
jgi:hypothetical protein